MNKPDIGDPGYKAQIIDFAAARRTPQARMKRISRFVEQMGPGGQEKMDALCQAIIAQTEAEERASRRVKNSPTERA